MSLRMPKIASLNRFTIAISIVTLLCLSVVVFTSNAFSGKKLATAAVESSTNTREPQSSAKKTKQMETELLKLTSRGFEPNVISRPAGEFLLMIENPESQELDLQLSRDTGAPVHKVKTSREAPDWNEIQDLQPGTYTLIDKNHPEWTCSITITAR
jgi:hypothetical protein